MSLSDGSRCPVGSMKIVYIAGPFRGRTPWDVAENVRNAERWGLEVAKRGAMPLIPHANTAHFDGQLDDVFWLNGTMELLRRCDAVLMVPGWRESEGAKAERAEALVRGIPVFDTRDSSAWRRLLAWIRDEGPVDTALRALDGEG